MELTQKFRNGEYGQTRMARPSILCAASGQPMLASDGSLMVADGKHCIQALSNLFEEAAKAKDGKPEWVTDELEAVFVQGLRVDLISFGDAVDKASVALYFCNAREADNNKLRAHSVSSKVKLVQQCPPMLVN